MICVVIESLNLSCNSSLLQIIIIIMIFIINKYFIKGIYVTKYNKLIMKKLKIN